MCITYLSRDSCRNLICKNLGPDGDSWAVAKAAADRDVCVVRGMQLNFNFQKTGAQAEIVWLFIFQSLLVVPYRTIE